MNTSAIDSGRTRVKPRSGVAHWCERNTKAFFRSTYLHGLKFAGAKRLTVWENAFFLIIFLICIVFGIYQAFNVFDKWQHTPVIIGIDAQSASLTEMPFPTVTVCNMNQLRASKALKLNKNTLDFAIREYLCQHPMDFSAYQNKTAKDGISILNFLLQNAHSCADIILRCVYDSREIACTDIFREVITDEGLCCIFNALHPFHLFKGDYYYIRQFTSTNGAYETPVSWSPSKGYPKSLPKRYYPRQVAGVGVSRGLSIVLNTHINEYYCSTTNGAGFKILLYNPLEEPDVRESGLPVIPGFQTRVRISIRRFETTSTVRGIPPRRRQCLFEDEKVLLYYKIYTRRNCERECDALFFYQRCQCIPYYLPLIFSNASSCYVGKFNCVRKHERVLNDDGLVACKQECLPSCFDVTYYPDNFRSPLQAYDIKDDFLKNFSSEYMRENIAIVHFFYQSQYYRSFMKTTYTGTTEYLALTGGIMSLMIGFSVISFVELIYFFIFRPVARIWQRRAVSHTAKPSTSSEPNRFRTLSDNPFKERIRRHGLNQLRNAH